MNWLEVALTVNGEAAEAVAEVLSRYAPEGVAIEALHFALTSEALGEAVAVGDVVVKAYLPADEALDRTRTQLEEALWHMGQLLPLPAPVYTPITNTDWSESWKANFKPLRVGKRLMIIPAWLNPPLEAGDIAIRLDPGMAFGTGTHPTTQLCLAALERHLHPGQTLLDIGTGSGILAIAGAKLGAARVWAVDIDPEAVRVSSENIIANEVAERVTIATGSLAETLSAHRQAPVVVANILARILAEMLQNGLANTVQPGGLLILSGILDSQVHEVTVHFPEAGLTLVAQEHIEDWVALIARRG